MVRAQEGVFLTSEHLRAAGLVATLELFGHPRTTRPVSFGNP